MTILDAIILGVVQGVSEFLPVSSSGHLILTHLWLGVGLDNGLAFDAVLQFATALALVIYFWRDLLALINTAWRFVTRQAMDASEERLMWALIVATVPAIILGLLLEHAMETIFRSGVLVVCTLIAGSAIMFAAEKWSHMLPDMPTAPGWKGALGVGLFQSLALVPGMSRSGMTISGSMFFGLAREQAARFSFLLGIPILLGSGGKKLLDIVHGGISGADAMTLFVAALTSFVVGLAVIHWLLRYLRTHSMMVFVWYRIAIAAIVLLVTFV